MRKILIAATAAVLPALAQAPDDLIRVQRDLQRREIEIQSTVKGPNFQLSFAGPNSVVKNAPYSADAITESTQVLSDGNRIVQRTTQKLYRDNDGRERREESILAVGALAQPDAPRVITISDPVDNVSYSLNPQQRTARKSSGAGSVLNWVSGPAAFTGYTYTVGATLSTLVGDLMATRPAATPGEPVEQDLGSKNVEGVIARGTRTTKTIPAGKIGNQLPIDIVDEVWFSPELQLNVMTTHSDPRSGETVYKLTNIVRANPARALFEPPSDYTVTGPPAGGGRGGRGPAPGAQK
jgi:hypothetical protein